MSNFQNDYPQIQRQTSEGSAVSEVMGTSSLQSASPMQSPSGTSGSNHSRKKRKKRHFSRKWQIFIEVYTLVLLLIGIASCTVLYLYLDAYEKSQHAHVMDDLMENTSDAQWKSYVMGADSMSFSSFDDQSAILSNYYDTSCLKDPSYSEAVSVSTKEAPVYNIKSGSAYMCRVFLAQDEDLAFGFNTWKVARIEPYIPMTSFASTTIHVEVPDSETVLVNGIVLGEEQILMEMPYEDLNELESHYDIVPHKVIYEVSDLYGSIIVTKADGTEMHPQSETDEYGAIFYQEVEGTYDIHITAPSNVSLLCCGVPIDSSFITATHKGFLQGYTAYTNGYDGSVVEYTLTGLHRAPELTEAYSGNVEKQILENGDVVYAYVNDEDLQDDCEYIVDRFFSSYIWYGAGYESEYYSLLSYILPDTSLYTYVEDSTAAMIWASDTSVDFDYLEYTDFIQWSDNCFSCRAAYSATMSAQAWYESYSYDLENAYDLIFIKQNGQWLAASMAVVE